MGSDLALICTIGILTGQNILFVRLKYQDVPVLTTRRLGMRKVRVEDYLLAIDRLCVATATELARSGQIASALGVSTGYVSTTLLRLADDGLIVLQPHVGAKLTELGRVRALRFARRLRITELLLERLLNWGRESVTDEAHRLEPAISDKLIEALDAFLGFPEFDRDGQTIPRPDDTSPQPNSKPI